MSTFDKVRDIFYSGNFSFTGDLEYINEISFLVDNGYLVLKTLDISSKEEFKHLLGKPSEVKELIYRAAGGTLPHIVLKILGGRRLEAMNKIPLFEHEFCGYFPDVMSEDKEIVIVNESPTLVDDSVEVFMPVTADPSYLSASLQTIISRFRIEGNFIAKVDFRFDKPVVILKNE